MKNIDFKPMKAQWRKIAINIAYGMIIFGIVIFLLSYISTQLPTSITLIYLLEMIGISIFLTGLGIAVLLTVIET